MTLTVLLLLAPAFASETAVADTETELEVAAEVASPASTPTASDEPAAAAPKATPVAFDEAARATKRVTPTYPRKRRGDGVSCVAQVAVDAKGLPGEVTFQECPADFQEHVSRALVQWRWEPAKLDDQPVESTFTVALQFP